MSDPVDRLYEQADTLRTILDTYFKELESIMKDDKIVQLRAPKEVTKEKENPFNVDPRGVKPRRGGIGGVALFGSAVHDLGDGKAKELELRELGKKSKDK